MNPFWQFVASPGASALAGVFCVIMIWRHGLHRAADGTLDRLKIANAVTLPAMFYTLIIVIIGELFLRIPASDTIKLGFGDGRVTWLLVVLRIDIGIRVVSLFDDANGR